VTKNITCYNCNKTGHFKLDCWAGGGGKEGQRPAGQGHRGPANATKPAADAAAVTPLPPVNFVFTSATSILHGQQSAIIDSGATLHFCLDHTTFITLTAIEPQDVQTADGTCISIVGQGDIQIKLPLGEACTTVTLRNVLYMPKMALTS
jgi:hypothetical protein